MSIPRYLGRCVRHQLDEKSTSGARSWRATPACVLRYRSENPSPAGHRQSRSAASATSDCQLTARQPSLAARPPGRATARGFQPLQAVAQPMPINPACSLRLKGADVLWLSQSVIAAPSEHQSRRPSVAHCDNMPDIVICCAKAQASLAGADQKSSKAQALPTPAACFSMPSHVNAAPILSA